MVQYKLWVALPKQAEIGDKVINGKLVKTEQEKPEAKSYKGKRQEEYPPVAEQLDIIFHAMEKGELLESTEFLTLYWQSNKSVKSQAKTCQI